MQGKMSSPHTTLVILLGASQWPKFPAYIASKAFANSAHQVKIYLLHSHQFGLPQENLLDLFDTYESASDIDEHISEFLDQRTAAANASGKTFTDLIVYFVGHGGFDTTGSDYYLAVRRTRQENPSGSGLRMAALAHTLKEKTRRLRRMLVLDCCFSGAAQKVFQGAPAQAAIQQTVAAFKSPRKVRGIPTRGTVLLCSSGSTIPSVISQSGDYTMFTYALLQALRRGVPHKQEQLSLREVFDLTIDILCDIPDEKAPNPELHSPDQSNGDVADIPFFPNFAIEAFTTSGYPPLRSIFLTDATSTQDSKREISLNPGNKSSQQSTSHSSQSQTMSSFPLVEVGKIIAGRYEIVQVISNGEDKHVYQIMDHQGYQHCWNCGSEENVESDEFCNDCGVELLNNVPYILHEYPTQSNRSKAEELNGILVNTFIHLGRTYCVETPPLSADLPVNHLQAAGNSDEGNEGCRPNADRILVLQHKSTAEPLGIFAVADGRGDKLGWQASNLAISVITEYITRQLLPEKTSEEDKVIELVDRAIKEANTAIYQKNQEVGTHIVSTISGFMILGNQAYIFNVGDSRTYMVREGQLYQLTNDHSLVGQLVAGGLIEPDDVYTHPQRDHIFRSLGDKLNIQIDLFKQLIVPSDILLSCSDGLWKMMRNLQIINILENAPDPQTACARLIEAANANGGEDNISVIVVFVS